MDKNKIVLEILKRQELALVSFHKNLQKIKKDFKLIEDFKEKNYVPPPILHFQQFFFFVLGALLMFFFLYLISFFT